ncbi:MAG: hypothetical protein NVS3B20_15330 [Polyangiales bacterium]
MGKAAGVSLPRAVGTSGLAAANVSQEGGGRFGGDGDHRAWRTLIAAGSFNR